MGHLSISPMEYPVIGGSTLAEIVERFELGPDDEASRIENWRGFAEIALRGEAKRSGAKPTADLGPLHKLGHDALVAIIGECLRLAWESQKPRRKRKRGIDIALCLFVVFLVVEERKLYPGASDNRVFTNLTQLLGPGIEPDTIRGAYKRGLRVYSTFYQREDEASILALAHLRETFFDEFWNAHKSSEKYREDRAFCQNSGRRKQWWQQ